MLDCLMDGILDTFKTIPYLFIAFYIIEFLEHKINSNKIINQAGRLGPLLGSLLGMIPHCGFSALATNLYTTRIITLGTLISVYLATSDEMLPIMLSSNVPVKTIIPILTIKVLIGIICGFTIDFILRKKATQPHANYSLCKEEHCHCETSYLKSSLEHTLNISLFILAVNIILNLVFHYGLETYLNTILLDNKILGPIILSLIGLIPNCASSIVITKLYLASSITFGSLIAGLLTNSGIGILVLFKSNKNFKENLTILGILYLIGIIFGILINFI